MHLENVIPDFPALVIDGSGSSVFAGVLDEHSQWLAQVEIAGAPLEELFPAVEKGFSESRLELKDLGSFMYSEGPGSVLGLRLCAMAIETWKRLFPNADQLFSYNSLHLTAATLQLHEPDLKNALIVSDWKKGAWNAIRIIDGQIGPTEVVDDDAIKCTKTPLYHLPQRKGWQSPPENATPLTYEPSAINQVLKQPDFLRPTAAVELYSSGINTFQKWTPTRHRAAN